MVGGKGTEKCYVYLYPVPFLVPSVHSVTNSTLANAAGLQHSLSTPRRPPGVLQAVNLVPRPRAPLTHVYAFFFTEI